MDDIIDREDQIQKLTNELDSISNDRKKQKLHEQIKQLRFDQETLIMDYLEKNDDNYKKILNLNFDLLENDNIIFAVTKESGNMFASYAKEFYGEIHSNGYLYFTTKDTNFIYLNLQAHLYPISYCGLINYFGETNIEVEETKFKMIGSRVPKKYKGSIDSNGNVRFNTIDSYWESDGHFYVKNIVADPFSGDDAKRQQFLNNRIEIKNIICRFRERINSR